ncbi:transposase [Streptomyces sp. NPDC052079]|uniref:IS110 family transposase n=1 Tax=Streptomyces sp. NPDC052079 TaxID=3155526 RepID=UPI00343E8845
MLAEHVDGVIGVDTHRDTLAAAAVSPIGAVLASTDSPANARGYRRLLDFARQQVPGRRCWALEGIGSYGAGLAAFLDQAGEQVVEVCRPKRAANRGGRKTDMLDAIRAAKEALATEHLIQPRLRGEREALRVLLATRHGAVLASTAAINQLKALIVSAPDDLRAELRKLKRPAQIAYCAQFRDRPAQSLEHRMTVRAMRSTARSGPAGRGQGAGERDPRPGAAAGLRASRPARSRADHRRPDTGQLVSPGTIPL